MSQMPTPAYEIGCAQRDIRWNWRDVALVTLYVSLKANYGLKKGGLVRERY